MNALRIAAFAMMLFMQSASGQPSKRTEFDMHANGLLYSETDMKILRHMVDSLNLRFKTCDLSRPYYSFPQARVLYVRFTSKTNTFEDIKKDIAAQMSFNDLIKKHQALISRMDTARVIIKTEQDGPKEEEYRYLIGNAEMGYEYSHTLGKKGLSDIKGKWEYDYSAKSNYSTYNSLECWFFPNDFERKKLPLKYAGLIQYVDCMIDTTAQVMLARRWPDEDKQIPAFMRMMDYINDKMGNKRDTIRDQMIFYYNRDRLAYAEKNLRNDPAFLKLLNDAIEECIRNNTGNDALESLAESLVSKQKALELKRRRIVVGGCSQDMSPRYHAREIAILAAETHSWEIFLRAHLDIMNDRFARVSDGSYAWGKRETYLKELEALNLNVIDLMLGLTLRSESTAENHYYGSVSRLGRALAESNDRKTFETRALEILKDNELDEFNRGLIFILYITYLRYIENKKEATASIQRLKNDQASYPAFLRPAISSLDPKEMLDE